jgi:hypothetical protein
MLFDIPLTPPSPPLLDWPLLVQLGTSPIAVHLLEWMKKSPRFSWISQHTGQLNRVLAFIIASATAAGVVWKMEGSWQAGAVITITLPPLAVLANALMHAVFQFLAQEGYYQTVVKK